MPRGTAPVDPKDENIKDSAGKNKRNEKEGESPKEAQSANDKTQSVKDIQKTGLFVSKIRCHRNYEWSFLNGNWVAKVL
jgi:hypothetical protein